MCRSSPDHQRPLHRGHDDGVLVEALHLLHAGDGQLFPPLQNDMVCPSILGMFSSYAIAFTLSRFPIYMGQDLGLCLSASLS